MPPRVPGFAGPVILKQDFYFEKVMYADTHFVFFLFIKMSDSAPIFLPFRYSHDKASCLSRFWFENETARFWYAISYIYSENIDLTPSRSV